MNELMKDYIEELVNGGWVKTKTEAKKLFKDSLIYTKVFEVITDQMKFLADSERYLDEVGEEED